MTTFTQISTHWSKYFIGYSTLGIIISTTLGSLAILKTLMNGVSSFAMFLVFLSVVICSAHNTAILTVQKPKTVLYLLIASIFINVVIILM